MPTANNTVENVKVLLGIEDALQDEVLDILISNVEKHLLLKLKRINKDVTDIPTDLYFVVEEIAIRRYNRIGSEGMKTESVEGHAISFYELADDWVPYEQIIDDHKDDDFSSGRGRVIFI